MTTETGIAICNALLLLAEIGVACLGVWAAFYFDGPPRRL